MSETKLGRNIEDLLRENAIEFNENEEVAEIQISKIYVNPKQPRKYFNETSIRELADSINEHGLLQPIILKSTNDNYMLVAGERRLRAMKLLGKETIPAIVRAYNEKHLTELAILENIQREDLTPIEEAVAYRNIIKDFHITHDKLAEKIGKSRSYITNIIGLLRLPEVVIEAVTKGDISMGHARVLSKLEREELILELYDRVVKENLTVRELEDITQQFHTNGKGQLDREYLENVKMKLMKSVSNKISFDVKKNKIVFSFKTKDELDRIVQFLKDKK